MSEPLYWNHTGVHEKTAAKLMKLIPSEGSVENPKKNKALERFRKAVNCYYDLYNNGLCNRAREFAKVYGFATSPYKYRDNGYSTFGKVMYARTENTMHDIIKLAAAEQNIVLE